MHTQTGLDHYKRITQKMGKTELQNIEKDLIIEFVVLRGAMELRKAVENDLSFIDIDANNISADTSLLE